MTVIKQIPSSKISFLFWPEETSVLITFGAVLYLAWKKNHNFHVIGIKSNFVTQNNWPLIILTWIIITFSQLQEIMLKKNC